MKNGLKSTPSANNLRALYEGIELGVLQSTNVRELDDAYQIFLNLSTSDQRSVADFAGPAKVVSIALRGYELPDAQTRNRSSQFVLDLSRLFETDADKVAAEQFWLMLAGQQDVLLQRIEDDLEALQDSSLEQSETKNRLKTLGKLHKLLRRKADEAVQSLFTVSLTPVQSHS